MNKAQLVEVIADQLGGRQQAADAVDHVLDAIVRAVVAGERVSVTGFGTFERAERSARYARNPQTGERVRVRKTSVPRFRAGQGFKDLVSGSKKLPRGGEISVKKAPKGSISGGAPVAVKKAAAKKTTTKKAAAKKTTRAPARKTTKTAAKKAIVTTSAAKKATAKKAPAKKSTAKRAPAKTDIKKTAAKKTKGNGGDTGPLTSKKAKSGGS